MLSATAKMSCFILLICSAHLTNAQFKAQVMLLPLTELSDIETADYSDSITFKEESLSANGSVKIEATSPEELLSFLEHEKGIGLVKAFFSMSKFPELQEGFRAVSYDVRKEEFILEQQDNGVGSE